MSVEQQEKIDDIKAIVILAIMSSQTKFVFYVSREDEKWVITEIGTILWTPA